jgi:hypothetical protein
MSHEEMQERLLDLLYGELPPREARQVEDHAASCEACRAELERMRATRGLMASLPEEPAPERGERILLAAAREAARRRAARPWLPRWAWTGALAASLVAVGAVSYRLVAVRPGGAGREDPRALMGDSPYAREPREGAPDAEAPAKRGGEGVSPGPPSPPRSGGEGRGAGASLGRPPSPTRSGGEGRGERASAPGAAPARRFAEPPPPEAEPPPSPAPLAAEAPAAAAAPAPAPAPAPRSRKAEAAPEVESRAPAAPPQAADEAAGAQAARAAPTAVLRYQQLRGAGSLRGEIQTFPGCEGEAWRKVERDPAGRVVSYAREGLLDGRRVRVEAIYGPDGAPARVTVTDLATAARVPGASAWVPRAEEADGPPRCGP